MCLPGTSRKPVFGICGIGIFHIFIHSKNFGSVGLVRCCEIKPHDDKGGKP